jgi:surface protein
MGLGVKDGMWAVSPTWKGMFSEAFDVNKDISGWDVGNVTTMKCMFYDAIAFNFPLNAWGTKTSKVIDMREMFASVTSFNQDIKGWSQNAGLTCTNFKDGSSLQCSNIPNGKLSGCSNCDV